MTTMNTDVLQRGVSTHLAAQEAGVTFRQADYWVRVGVIEPTVPARGSGNSRSWSDHDVALLRVCGHIAAALERAPTQLLAAAVDLLRPLPLTWWPELLELPASDTVTVTVRIRPPA